MINPETLPCSIEQLFNLPPPQVPKLAPTAAKSSPNKRNPVSASRGTVTNPVIPPPIAPSIVPPIAPKVNIPLRVVANEPKMIVNKVEKGLSTGWWIVIACVAGIGVGLFLAARHKHNVEERKEKDPASSN